MKIETELDKHYEKDCLLLRDTFPDSDVGNLKHYSWKYLKYPLGTPTLVKFLTDADDTVIARSSLLPQNITISGQTYKAALSVDSAIHKDYRNLKLFVQLMNYIIKDSKTKKYS
ncbi:MAG: GNAT family N-acetyltransferase, partial [Candidatus Hodarchaeota archaeon]